MISVIKNYNFIITLGAGYLYHIDSHKFRFRKKLDVFFKKEEFSNIIVWLSICINTSEY